MKLKVTLKDGTVRQFELSTVHIIPNKSIKGPVIMNLHETKEQKFTMNVTANLFPSVETLDKIEFEK
jgi:predicted acyl esterase